MIINQESFFFFFLSLVGLLNPLDSPHHMRIDEESDYREGVVVDRPTKQNKGSFVDCGMRKVSYPAPGAQLLLLYSLFIGNYVRIKTEWCSLSWSHRKFRLISSCSLDYESQYGSARHKIQVLFFTRLSRFLIFMIFSTWVKFWSIYLWNCLQKAKYIKVLSWLLTCPGLKVVIIGATVFVWHLVSVGFPFNSQHCASHSFAVCINDYCKPLLYPRSCLFPVPAGAVFTESPFKEGYDLTIGTSERGSNADQALLTPFK